jgi:hypothetical protein
LDFDPRRVKIGRLLRITGRIVGRDIVEPLKMVIAKSHNGVELPGELSTLIIRRPTVQILATQVRALGEAKRPRQKPKDKPGSKPAETPILPAVSVEPGLDLAELIPAQ